jgi:hypothetical protein
MDLLHDVRLQGAVEMFPLDSCSLLPASQGLAAVVGGT